ncbi:MAG: VOC family protein, partial [Blastococcus sp.]
MPVQRLNHAVLYVRDVERSSAFYRDVLGFRAKMEIPGRAVFLQAEGSTNDHDLGLFQIGAAAGPSTAGRSTVGLYHL